MNELDHKMRASGASIAGAIGFHLLAGGLWFFVSLWMWMGRYLFCSNEPDSLGSLFVFLAASWVPGTFFAAWIRSRGGRAWPWSLAWFFVAILVFTIALYSGPEPTDCGFGSW